MEVELRRFTALDRMEIIEPLAELIDKKVDLREPTEDAQDRNLGQCGCGLNA